MHLSDEKRADLRKRLNRIEGQIRGIQRMIDEDRYCGDVLAQFASAQQALRGAASVVTRNHLETCVTDALRSGNEEAARRSYDEIMSLLSRQIG